MSTDFLVRFEFKEMVPWYFVAMMGERTHTCTRPYMMYVFVCETDDKGNSCE
jgi:hypothetical protein